VPPLPVGKKCMQYILEHHLLLPPKLLALHRYRIDSPYMDDAIADEHKLRRCSFLELSLP
jgi:hypothetical protein